MDILAHIQKDDKIRVEVSRTLINQKSTPPGSTNFRLLKLQGTLEILSPRRQRLGLSITLACH